MNELRVNHLIQFNKKGILKESDTAASVLSVMSSDNIRSIIITNHHNRPIPALEFE